MGKRCLKAGCLFVLLAGCAGPAPPNSWKISGPAMGTTFNITIADPSRSGKEPNLEAIAKDVEKALADINLAMSTYDPTSEISRFNDEHSTEPFAVSRAFAEVVHRAKEIHAESGGRFDITVAPLVDLWGFGKSGPRQSAPSEEEISAAKSHVGSEKLEVTLDPPTLRKRDAELRIDLNALAPGYGVDVLAKIIETHGFHHYLVEIGGEFLAKGHSPSDQPWRIAIEQPDREGGLSRQIQRVLEIENGAIATSGDYRNFVEYDGVTFSHTIDPVTGSPVRHSLASVTILTDDCMSADALATAVLVLGPKEGAQFVEKQPGVEAWLIERHEEGKFQETHVKGPARKEVWQP